ncbi:hypothetical protein [Algoriphagus antarcticus]|uniref:Dolichyl-phosphate-mannose-protein mannosyltransferase n=1 Tax=Algoriphagus antarcticus TaxID=238540 RepID=A0A3E0DQB7_9BACT|nr:hypothetical protein [Algoriphagus antarcticus]REG84432.1 hypothetical protein C8N25_1156 [Algoriphagus antarcticus]
MGLTVLLVLIFVLCLLNQYDGQSWGDDFSLYLNQARSLVEGNVEKVLEDTAYAIHNSTVPTFSPVSYPWGFPLLLSPLYYFFGKDFETFKILETIFLIGFLFVFDRLLEDKLSSPSRLLLIAFVGLNQLFIYYTNYILSEIPFLFFSTLSLFVLQKTGSQGFSLKPNLWAGVWIFFAFNIRTEGIALLAALLFYQVFTLLQKKVNLQLGVKTLIIYASPYFVFLSLYFLTKLILPAGFASHLDFLEYYSLKQSLRNMEYTFRYLGSFINKDINLISLILIVLLFFLGILKRWKEDFLFLAFWFSVLGILFIWPFFWDRYMYVLIPLFCYFFLRGLEYLSTYLVTKNYALYFLLILLLFNLFPVYTLTKNSMENRTPINGPESPENTEMFDFIRAQVAADEVVVFGFPRLMNFYTGRKSLFIYDNIENVQKKGDYLVIFKNWDHDFQLKNTLSISFRDGFEIVFENRSFIIYSISKEPQNTD